jgi:hypothetical protein
MLAPTEETRRELSAAADDRVSLLSEPPTVELGDVRFIRGKRSAPLMRGMTAAVRDG